MKRPNSNQIEAHRLVCDRNMLIRDVASEFGVSRSTIQSWIDAVSDFNREEFTLTLNGNELRLVLGWLRNGNWSALDLADSIEERLEVQPE